MQGRPSAHTCATEAQREDVGQGIGGVIDRDQYFWVGPTQCGEWRHSTPMVSVGFFDVRFRSASLLLAGLLLLGVASGRACAQELGDVAAGRTLAEKWCSSCHVVTSSQQLGTSTGAPTFFAIARMKSTTRLSLRVFFETSHDRMPNLHLSRDEVDNVSAYILSLPR